MPKVTVPNYVSDPPVVWRHYDRETVARRWLMDIGSDAPDPGPATFELRDVTHALATKLDTSKEHIASILHEGYLQHHWKRMLAEVFDPVLHEVEARRQYARLFRMTRDRPSLSGRKAWVHPEHARHEMDFLRREFADYPTLIEEWSDWAATWEALVARNPPLELRRRMGEVFDTNSSASWDNGRERLFYDWLARGTRDPMPFSDTRKIITEAYYRRLCELRDLSNGWFYCRDDLGPVFVSLADWEVISATWPAVLEQVCAQLEIHKGP